MGFDGTLLVVSHDRAFLDNVVTSTLVWEGDGQWRPYVGGYEDWLRQRPVPEAANGAKAAPPKAKRSAAAPRRMGYQERREMSELPRTIERLEAERSALFGLMSSPEFYTRPGAEIATARERLATLEADIQKAYARWMELERFASGAEASS
jgi:ATP-binding cassette subfamily F protein uup